MRQAKSAARNATFPSNMPLSKSRKATFESSLVSPVECIDEFRRKGKRNEPSKIFSSNSCVRDIGM
jgi:hypothetical protein